ncbi:restriction endonuclease subunit S [Azospirillum soli]|uniref:restriction endonuclease subunit S n=1 Tax=Azospirillum soli TaxID=1304799 RepID=UPI001AE83B56|nr:restriction endonuclease subunit S [Azospirillum soli]MBP2316929.1 type I restriction enzyme S subunit [Azospirillum soli]
MNNRKFWHSVKLSQVATVQSGAGFPLPYQGEKNGEYPFYKVSDMNIPGNEVFMHRHNNAISEDVRKLLKAKPFPLGSVIFPKIGAAIATNKKRIVVRPSCADNNVMGIIPDEKTLSPEFLYYILNSKNLSDFASASNPPSIRKSEVEDWIISVPPLDEQRRIVDILNHAASIRRLRDETRTKVREIVPALFVEMFGDPATNPKGWTVVGMVALYAEKPNYGTMLKPNTQGGTWLDLRVANIQGGKLDLSDRKYVELSAKDIARHSVFDGDLLMARAIGSRDHLGKCVIAYPGKEKWAFDSHLMRVRLNVNKALPIYIKALLETESGRRLFLEKIRQSAVQFNINVGEFSSIVVPLPPLSVQQEFAERVAEIEATAALSDKAAAAADQLSQSLLSQVFGQRQAEPVAPCAA